MLVAFKASAHNFYCALMVCRRQGYNNSDSATIVAILKMALKRYGSV